MLEKAFRQTIILPANKISTGHPEPSMSPNRAMRQHGRAIAARTATPLLCASLAVLWGYFRGHFVLERGSLPTASSFGLFGERLPTNRELTTPVVWE